eukprot:TRINITY_DN3311_c3_g1_i1.p1 TRINITY_DN3311_c3_g1~~TRINITY_DN3311_c3_g1_i1.p1  ORF type:complete len:683 (+),score=110.04 TRINITY_DN3311_c3_g1_i1:36-2084(+)
MGLINYSIGVILILIYTYFAASKRLYGIICRIGVVTFYFGSFTFIFVLVAQVVFAACKAKIRSNVFNLVTISILLFILIHVLFLSISVLPMLLKKYWNRWWFIKDFEDDDEVDTLKKTMLNVFYRSKNNDADEDVAYTTYNNPYFQKDSNPENKEKKKLIKIPFYHSIFLYRSVKIKRELVTNNAIYEFVATDNDLVLKALESKPLLVWVLHMMISGVYSIVQLIYNGKSFFQTIIYCLFMNVLLVCCVVTVSLLLRIFSLFCIRVRDIFQSPYRDDLIKKVMFIVSWVLIAITCVSWLATGVFKTVILGIAFICFYLVVIYPFSYLLAAFTSTWSRIKVITLDITVVIFFWILLGYIRGSVQTGGFLLEAGDSLTAANKLLVDCDINYSPLESHTLPTVQQYTFCDEEVVEGQNFTKLDLLAFAKLAYNPYAFKYYRKLQYFGFTNERTKINHYGAYYNVYSSTKLQITIVAIRGTVFKVDWMMDLQMYVDALVLQFISEITPFGGYIPQIFKQMLMKTLQYTGEIMNYQDVDYFPKLRDEIFTVVQNARNRGDKIYFVGHSLGGGLANLLAGYYKESSFTISPVGSLLTRIRYDIEANTMLYSNEMVIPLNDFVPMIDQAYGNVHTIRCQPNSMDLMYCHRLGNSFKELGAHCSNQDMYDMAFWDLANYPSWAAYSRCPY